MISLNISSSDTNEDCKNLNLLHLSMFPYHIPFIFFSSLFSPLLFLLLSQLLLQCLLRMQPPRGEDNGCSVNLGTYTIV